MQFFKISFRAKHVNLPGKIMKKFNQRFCEQKNAPHGVLAMAIFGCIKLGPKKCQKIARMYDRTGLSTKCTLIKIDLFRPSDPNSDLFRPFVEALIEAGNPENFRSP